MGITALAKALMDLSNPTALLLMASSTALGVLVGCLPGLTATMGIALLTGLTFGMPSSSAITVLMGIYIGAMYGGSVSAILLNIPGTGAAAATCLDGHELARKGHAATAIMLARVGSVIGTLIGMICLVIFTPLLTRLALSFTSPEYFLVSFFGVLICGSISSPDLKLKGWLAGLLGLMLAFIGIEGMYAWPRFTFGSQILTGGIPLIPALIGLFGVPQVMKALADPGTYRAIDHNVAGETVDKGILRFVFGRLRMIIQSGLIGVGIGVIPAVGENVAAWVAYDSAKRISKDGDKFGKGAYDGVIAPEVANNACIGGSLIPTLSLAIPGSPPAAVLMGALILHGIRPGPMLSFEFPTLLYELGAMLIIGSLILVVLGIVLAKPLSKVLDISPTILMPIITVLCVIGTYAVNLSTADLAVMILFGALGYLLNHMGYPPAATLLGLLLGGMADVNFRRTLRLSRGNAAAFVSRPFCILFTVLIVYTILSQLGVISWLLRRLGFSSNKGQTRHG